MLDSGHLGQLTVGIFYLVVGMVLLRLSHRTREKPERYLGYYFLLTGVDYFVYSSAEVFRLESIFDECAFISRVAYAFAVIHLVIFIREVFRPGETWAIGLATVFSLALVASIIGPILEGNWADVGVGDFWYWPNFVGYTGALIWLTIEAIRVHAGARRRLRVGLCERTIVNRYLLWAFFGASQVLACGGVLMVGLDIQADSRVSAWSDAFLSGSELISIAMVWLAFFPPAAYLRWITDSQAGANSKAEG